MSQPAFDVARHDIWYTDGGTGFYVVHITNGAWPANATAQRPAGQTRCPAATGSLHGLGLGPARLGATRARVRRAFAHSAVRRQGAMDRFCLRGGAIRVGYRRGRAVIALTANRHYALKGIRPGTRWARVSRRLRAGHGTRVGKNTWYAVLAGRSRGVLKVSHGRVGEIGLATRAVSSGPRARRRLFSHLL